MHKILLDVAVLLALRVWLGEYSLEQNSLN